MSDKKMRNRFKKRGVTPIADPDRVGNHSFRVTEKSTKRKREEEKKQKTNNQPTSLERAVMQAERVERKKEKHRLKIQK